MPQDEDAATGGLMRGMPALRALDMTSAERAAAVADVEYWRALCPELHVCDPEMRQLAEVCSYPSNDACL